MCKTNRILSLLLAAVMVLSLLPVQTLAAAWQSPVVDLPVTVNPLYADLFTEEDILALLPDRTPGTIRPQATSYLDLESGAQELRDGMTDREEIIEVSWCTTVRDYNDACHEIMDLAMAHTGQPKEGDSLRWVYAGWGVDEIYRSSGDGVYNFTAFFKVYYYTTAEQEAELDQAVEELLAELDLDDESDYQKISQVYTYICDHITYDYENLYDNNYLLKYTAYAALVNKTSVCQGYAVLFYRLMLELGVDCRLIAGYGNGGGHAWNIVELDGLYYNVDTTWDAGNYVFYWFMKSFWGFGLHERDMEYDTIAFHNEYPMSALDHRDYYIEGIDPYMDPYIYAAYANVERTAIWYLNRDGTIEFTGTGDCHDYSADEWPLHGYWADEITGLWVEEGITSLGTFSFYDFDALKKVELPTTLSALDEGCFRDCDALTEIHFTGDAPSIAADAFHNVTATAYYPGDNGTWTADKLQNYGGSLTWVPEGEAHTHSYESVVTAPTCTEQGYTTYTCACGDSYVDDYTDALDHDLGAWHVVTEPGCTEAGLEERACTRCGHKEQRAVDAKGHSYEPTVTAPTCTEQGYTTYTCACGDSYVGDYTDALGHDLGAWRTVTEATCTKDGSEQRDCSRCDHTESRVIEAKGHSYEPVVTAPTCTEQGYTTYTCACGERYVDDYTDALGHDWDEGIVIKEPTEEEYGERLHTCTVCGETKVTNIPPLTHTHSYEPVVTAPTCTEQGYTTYTCACGDSYVDDYTDALGHDLGAWDLVTEPGCTEPGLEERSCTRCDHKEQRAIDAKGHSHESVVTAPTCTEQGYTTYTCACGDSYVDDYTDALGHDWQGSACVRCGAVYENPFTDVSENQFCYESVLWALQEGITKGVTDTTFNPNGTCQRGTVVTFLWRAAGSPEPTTTENPFTDVSEDRFFYKAVLWAVENGITKGTTATTFSPYQECNRATVVTFLYRALGEPEISTAESEFSDVTNPKAYYYNAVLWAAENNVTKGMGDGSFGVNVICNRGQVVTFLYRAYVN